MTKKELSQLYWLNREIEQDRHRLCELEAAATDTTVKISGLPHVSYISDKTAIAAEIADVKQIIDAKMQMAVAEYNRLNRYIASIEDSMVRQIVYLRFVKGYSWENIASDIGGNTEDSVRKRLDRYLSKKLSDMSG